MQFLVFLMLKSVYTTSPMDVSAGDVFVIGIKAMVIPSPSGLVVRLYQFPIEVDKEPQGDRMYVDNHIVHSIFSLLRLLRADND